MYSTSRCRFTCIVTCRCRFTCIVHVDVRLHVCSHVRHLWHTNGHHLFIYLMSSPSSLSLRLAKAKAKVHALLSVQNWIRKLIYTMSPLQHCGFGTTWPNILTLSQPDMTIDLYTQLIQMYSKTSTSVRMVKSGQDVCTVDGAHLLRTNWCQIALEPDK